MEGIRSTETSAHIRTTRRYIPEDGNYLEEYYLWDVISCRLVELYRCFEEKHCLHPQDRRVSPSDKLRTTRARNAEICTQINHTNSCKLYATTSQLQAWQQCVSLRLQVHPTTLTSTLISNWAPCSRPRFFQTRPMGSSAANITVTISSNGKSLTELSYSSSLFHLLNFLAVARSEQWWIECKLIGPLKQTTYLTENTSRLRYENQPVNAA
jgi:hypothetical protein